MNLIEQLFSDEPCDDPRGKLERLTAAMQGLAETYEPALSHYRMPGLYGRRIYVPAGLCVATRVHKQAHFTIALKGQCAVVDQDGNQTVIRAPDVFITQPGTQRACLAMTDVEWLTVHACEPTDDPADMTDLLTFKSFAEFHRWKLVTAGEAS